MKTSELRIGQRLVIVDGPYTGATGRFQRMQRHNVEEAPPVVIMQGEAGPGFHVGVTCVEPVPEHAHPLHVVPLPRTNGVTWGLHCPHHAPAWIRATKYDRATALRASAGLVCLHR
ncbi:hypothetical protein [Streptomyces sp. NRRL B-1347]|uniref:hypothetical protein n=1 Tax=Streptomyces sp. NRRL B-1347 TaxID=1476877 RepID=UPI0004C94281|nr:hypothetical protein [Streptomyces sp. NRRL B-1347]